MAVESHGVRLSHANKAKLRPISSHEADCEATIDLMYVNASESLCRRRCPISAVFIIGV